jgi:hypothetical protein
MELIPYWETNSHSAGQEISHFSWNPKIYYRVHNSLQMVI